LILRRWLLWVVGSAFAWRTTAESLAASSTTDVVEEIRGRFARDSVR